MTNQESSSVRLPTDIKPHHYNLTLKPNLKDYTFQGEVQIEYSYNTSCPIKEVTLHSLNLFINSGSAGTASDPSICLMTSVFENKQSETVTILFEESIPSHGIITLGFRGELGNNMYGFYRTSYKIDGVQVDAATTQFEPTYARRCFPCWDEPAVKATFSTTIVYDKNTVVGDKLYPNVALSNMPIVELSGEDKMTAKFDKTVEMSTYLLAFIVGPFEYVEASDGKRVHRVYTVPGKKEHGLFALDVGCKALRYYEDYFNVEYPLKKLDQIAIPDFLSGAMENWGLVTYREICLLVEPGKASTARKQGVAMTVTHELAHQWFGNLVTMEWWTHLWLNEGFASFMEFLCVDHIFPEWDIWSQFAADTYGPAMDLDALDNSHPVEVPIKSPAEIDEIFDDISYCKGSSVIRMLYQFIGDESFRQGMHCYLIEYAYKNAVTEDLWKSLEQASGKPVAKLMSGWTSKKGYPWLSLKYSQEGGDSVKLAVSQSKFTAHGKMSDEDSTATWMIPVDAITGANPTKVISLGLLEGKENVVTLESVGDSWIKLNAGTVGLYRTAYPEEMSKKLLQAISAQTIPAIDRYGLLNDFFALCQAGKVSTTQLLKLLESYKGETHYTVWVSIDKCFGHLSKLLSNTEFSEKLNSFGIKVYSEIFKKLTWNPQPNEKYTDPMLRALVISRLVSFGEEGVIDECKRRYEAHISKTQSIPADLMSAVFAAVSSYGDIDTFHGLIEHCQSCTVQEEKTRLERAIGGSKNVDRLSDVIDFIFSETVRSQDKVPVVMFLASSHPSAGWKLFTDRLTIFRKMFEGGHLMGMLVKGCINNLVGQEHYQEVENYFATQKIPGVSDRIIQQCLERVSLSTEWLRRDGAEIEAFLTS